VNVDRPFVDLRRPPPHKVEQLRAREHAARPFEQIFQQLEVGLPEVNEAVAAPHEPRDPVEIRSPA
jgi:hypothetical protein